MPRKKYFTHFHSLLSPWDHLGESARKNDCQRKRHFSVYRIQVLVERRKKKQQEWYFSCNCPLILDSVQSAFKFKRSRRRNECVYIKERTRQQRITQNGFMYIHRVNKKKKMKWSFTLHTQLVSRWQKRETFLHKLNKLFK